MSTSSTSDHSFFNKERDRITAEIASGFEELLSSSNNLNRKLEEVLGMTREYETVATLWKNFHDLMKGQRDDNLADRQQQPGLPGTGGHLVVSGTQ